LDTPDANAPAAVGQQVLARVRRDRHGCLRLCAGDSAEIPGLRHGSGALRLVAMGIQAFWMRGGPCEGEELVLEVNGRGRPKWRQVGTRCGGNRLAVYDYDDGAGTFRFAYAFSPASVARHSDNAPPPPEDRQHINK